MISQNAFSIVSCWRVLAQGELLAKVQYLVSFTLPQQTPRDTL